MRRPLLCACLVLVIAVAIGKILTGDSPGGFAGLPPDKSPVEITGRIDTITSEMILLDSISLIQNDLNYSYSGKIQWKLTNTLNADATGEKDIQQLKVGQTVRLSGELLYFSSATNPGEFDARSYYAVRNIGAGLTKVRILAVGTHYRHLREGLRRLREKLHDRLAAVFPEKEASVMQTLLLGEKEGLDSDIKELYQRNGIAHILSISGLHITLLGMGLYRLLRRCGVPVRVSAAVGGCVLLLYGMMTGMSVSAGRAIGMYLLRMLSVIVGRTYDMLTALGLLAVLLVVQNPARLGDAGFLLSFGAVAGICLLTPVLSGTDNGREDRSYAEMKYREGFRKWSYEKGRRVFQVLRDSLAASAGVILFTLPVQLWFFYEVPVYSVVLNLLVLPWMSLLVAGGLLALCPGLGILGTVDCLILWWYEWICGRFEQLPGAVWTVGQPESWQVVCYYLGLAALLLWKRGWSRRRERKSGRIRIWCGLGGTLGSIAILLGILTGDFDGRSYVTFLDVGQGDGIVVETPQGAYLFDCGSTSRRKVGEYVLKPYLKYRGIISLQGVFVSHPDEDHMNGILELLEQSADWGIEIEQLFFPAIPEEVREEDFAKLLVAAETAGVSVRKIGCGDEICAGDLRLLCLHPEKETDIRESNAYSECFYLELTAGRLFGAAETSPALRLLLTGDVEGDGEQQLTEALHTRVPKGVDLFKAAHHGSGYTNSAELLEAVHPDASTADSRATSIVNSPAATSSQTSADSVAVSTRSSACQTVAIISCARNNSYGHPHAETLERLDAAGIDWYGTMDYGALTASIDCRGRIRLRGYVK